MIPTLAQALADKGYDTLTPVQTAVADPELVGHDLLVSAQTGSGKTVGFGLAIGPTILGEDTHFGDAARPLALVVAPTRELAMQVRRELTWLYAPAGAVLASTVGGMDARDERRALERGAHIVVATPGRLRDHITRGSIDLSDVRAVVLDEADEMLDLGFKEDLEFILASAPEGRRTLMFSATVPPLIERMAREYQTDAKRIVTTATDDQHADIEYRALNVAQHDGDNAIVNLLRYYEAPNAIVFANTRATVTRLTTRLSNRGFAVVALSGELSQQERSHALQAMRDGRARVCVATDVAARGIDLPNLELVIHAELPTNAEILMHRSGRTGRAGRKGVSAMIVPPKMYRRARNLLTWGKLEADWGVPPTADEILARDEDRLMTDEVWDETPSEAELAFADRLLAAQDPRTIAAAYLRLFRGRRSAPEDLSEPPAPGAGYQGAPDRAERSPRERKQTFGPSKWFRLDVGREQKAEARWLLPMICKAGDITKTEIGAIRIQPEETFVEIAEGAVDGFLAAIGPEGTLERGARIEPVDGTPQIGARGPRPHKRDHDAPGPAKRPTDGPARPARDRAPRDGADRADAARSRPERPTPEADQPARKPRTKSSDRPEKAGGASRSDDDRPVRARKVWTDRPASDKGNAGSDRPARGGRPDGGKTWAERGPKASGPARRDGGGGKSRRPDGPAKGPAKPRKSPTDASDTSKRFAPPGRSKAPPKGSRGGGGKAGKPKK